MDNLNERDLQFEIDDSISLPKYLQIVNIIESWINQGVYKVGDKIPSINEISIDFDVARDTVDKAFADLKSRGIVSSVKGKGFYVAIESVQKRLMIGMFFNRMTHYNQDIYYALYDNLKDVAFVDLIIYHNDGEILESQIKRYLKSYNYFVVIPPVRDNCGIVDILAQIPSDKLVVIKRVLDEFEGRFSAVYQDLYSDML